MAINESDDVPVAPPHLGEAGRDFWDAVVGAFTFGPHEMEIVLRACECVDSMTILQSALDADGHVVDGRIHPALVERRLQGTLLSKYIAGLRIPDPHALQGAPQRRGPRGAYQPRTGA